MNERRAIELLLREADSHRAEGRYTAALQAASAALQAARELDDVGLRVRALSREGTARRLLGDHATALARYTEVLALAEDPTHGQALATEAMQRAVAWSFMNWIACARIVPDFAAADLLSVLDHAEAWLHAVGRGRWRAGLCHQRASVLKRLGRRKEARGYAEEAIALAERDPGAPGYTLAGYRWSLGDLLREEGETERAAGQYQRVLDDRASRSHDYLIALKGLAQCALARGELLRAQELAGEAVRLAEGMGDDVVFWALEVAVEAARRAGDLPQARAAADRRLRLARRLGAYRLSFAVFDRFDVALDEGDRTLAEDLLREFAPLVHALDGATGHTGPFYELMVRRRRLARVPAPG